MLVTHDAEAALLADRRYTLRDGKLLDAADQLAADEPDARGARARSAGG